MTSYLVRYNQTTGITKIVIKAGIYEMRMAQINFWGYSGTAQIFTANYLSVGTTISGGTAIDVVPLRQNAPTASATAQQGPSISFSPQQGLSPWFTGTMIGSAVLPPGSSTSGTITVNSGSTAQMSFPLPTILSPGAVFVLTNNSLAQNQGAEIYFEELRLSGSY